MESGIRRAEKMRSLNAASSYVGGYSSSASSKVPQMAQGVGASTTTDPVGSVIRTGLRLVENVLDYVRRPALDLVIYVSQVGADDAQAEELRTAEEEDEDDQGGEAARHTAWVDEADHDLEHYRDECQGNYEQAQPCDQVQRQG